MMLSAVRIVHVMAVRIVHVRADRAFLDAGAGAQVVQRCAAQCWHRIIDRRGWKQTCSQEVPKHVAHPRSRVALHLPVLCLILTLTALGTSFCLQAVEHSLVLLACDVRIP